jgi:hypothetical protein
VDVPFTVSLIVGCPDVPRQIAVRIVGVYPRVRAIDDQITVIVNPTDKVRQPAIVIIMTLSGLSAISRSIRIRIYGISVGLLVAVVVVGPALLRSFVVDPITVRVLRIALLC